MKDLNSTNLTLEEYASKIGAKLLPTVLAHMPVTVKGSSDGESYFGGSGFVTEWLAVKDPSGGVNGCGFWPASVQKLRDGSLVVSAS